MSTQDDYIKEDYIKSSVLADWKAEMFGGTWVVWDTSSPLGFTVDRKLSTEARVCKWRPVYQSELTYSGVIGRRIYDGGNF